MINLANEIKRRVTYTDHLIDKLNVIKNIAITCYITSKRDPQKRKVRLYRKSNDYNYIKPWYDTVKEKGIYGIIFHDKCSNSFIKKYQTDKIFFVKCKMGPYSINDERFIVYTNFLSKFKFDFVVATDVSDVEFNKDPFEFIKEKDKIYVGSDLINPMKKQPMFRLYKKRVNFSQKKAGINIVDYKKDFEKYQLYSAGIIGGSHEMMLEIFKEMTLIFCTIRSGLNNNMFILNYVLHKKYMENYNNKTHHTKYIITGKPLHSDYKKYEKLNETYVYIIHK